MVPIYKYFMHHFRFCFSVKEQASVKAFRLKERLACYTYASDSTVLSVSSFILNHFPKLRPPNITKEFYSTIKFNEAFVDCSISYHPLDTAWTSYIMDLVADNHGIYHQNTLFVDIPVEELPNLEQLNKSFEQIEMKDHIADNHERCRFLFNLPVIDRPEDKIGIVSYRPRSSNILQPHLNTPALFLGNLYNNQHWKIIKLVDNQAPSLEELLTFSRIILPGSTYNISDDLPGIIKSSLSNILKAYQLNKELKLVGVCFGHQLISQYFGGKIVKMKRIDGIETIQYDLDKVKQYPFLSGIADQPKMYLTQYHGDYVTTIPKDFVHLAKSKTCEFQSFVSTNQRIFTVQFHSEYFYRFSKRLEAVFTHFYGPLNLSKVEDPQCQDLQSSSHHHSRLLLQCIRKFLDH